MGVVFGSTRAQDWEPAWGQHYLTQRRGTPAAANHDMAVFSVVFAHAVRSGLLDRNPVREVRRHPALPRTRYVTDAELRAFRRHCPERLLAYIDLKLATGCRQSQLVALKWCHWDGRGLVVAPAKRGRATTYVGAGVAEALERCAQAFWSASSAMMAPNAAIICTLDGRPYSAAQAWMKVWDRAMSKHVGAGGRHFVEHDLRAKVASDSADVHVAQARLGHQTTTITERVYRRAPVRVESALPHSTVQPDLFEHRQSESAAPLLPPGRAPRKDAQSAKPGDSTCRPRKAGASASSRGGR